MVSCTTSLVVVVADNEACCAAFIEFEDTRDAEDAVRKLDGESPFTPRMQSVVKSDCSD